MRYCIFDFIVYIFIVSHYSCITLARNERVCALLAVRRHHASTLTSPTAISRSTIVSQQHQIFLSSFPWHLSNSAHTQALPTCLHSCFPRLLQPPHRFISSPPCPGELFGVRALSRCGYYIRIEAVRSILVLGVQHSYNLNPTI